MPQVAGLEEKLQSIREALKQGSLEMQDLAINDLHNDLDLASAVFFPSWLYPSLINVLTFYCAAILPKLSMSAEDRQSIRAGFERTIDRLHAQEQHARDLEAQFTRLFQYLKSGTLTSVSEIVAALHTIVAPQTEATAFPVHTQPDKALEKQYRALRKTPFTSQHVRPFFEALVHDAFSEELQEQFEPVRLLFWDQLNNLLQMQAVLVNTITKEALFTRLDLETILQPLGLDELEFENTVDDRMYLSCWNAVQAARVFLEQQFPDLLQEQALHVRCHFPNPAMEYNDASASLLVGLKVVGDVLDLEVDPHVVASGEVDESGHILPVDHVAEKLSAAERQPEIQQFYLPEDGLYVRNNRIAVVNVQMFSETVEGYYGNQLRQKMRWQLSRRQVVKGMAVTLAAVSAFWTFKNIFTQRVTEQDLWNVEYAKNLYQKQGNGQKAMDILQFVLKKFKHMQSSTEVLHIQAQAFTHLGLIYAEQHKIQEGLFQLQRASDLLRTLHDKENQVRILIYIADAYYHSVAEDGIAKSSDMALWYLHQANEMLKPFMQTYRQSKCDYYGALGSLYNELDEYELAKTNMEKSLEYFDETDGNWSYHLSRQCLGRILVRLGEYDKAFDILDGSLQVPVLQRPYNQVRAFRGLSDLFLSIGNEQEGWHFAEKASKLCKDCGLKTQQIALQKMLRRHNASFTVTNFL